MLLVVGGCVDFDDEQQRQEFFPFAQIMKLNFFNFLLKEFDHFIKMFLLSVKETYFDV